MRLPAPLYKHQPDSHLLNKVLLQQQTDMVRNITGGSHAKSQARKNVVPRGGGSGTLRVAQEEGEIFVQVERMLGGSNCHVICTDGVVRLCVIRGKFRGRGRRDNVLAVGSLVMVGMRDYESSKGKDKMENCDLLEVYRDVDKVRIRSMVKIDWSNLPTIGCTGTVSKASSAGGAGGAGGATENPIDNIVFITDEQLELERLTLEQEANIAARTLITKTNSTESEKINASTSSPGPDIDTLFGDDDDDVDVDDI